jgi:ribonuclease P protein component
MNERERLKARKDFVAVYRHGRAWANRLLVLRALPNDLPCTRYGFVVSKRVGKAVVRNWLKRRLREGLRSLSAATGWDLVLLARPPAAQASYHDLREAIANLLSRARLLDRGDPVWQQAGSTGQTGEDK